MSTGLSARLSKRCTILHRTSRYVNVTLRAPW